MDEREIKVKVSRRELSILENMALELREQRHNLRIGVGNAAGEIISLVLKRYPQIVNELLGVESESADAAKPKVNSHGERMLTDEDLDRYPQAGVRRVDQPRRTSPPDEKTGTDG